MWPLCGVYRGNERKTDAADAGPREIRPLDSLCIFARILCDKALTMTNPEDYITPLGAPPLEAMACFEKPLTVCAVNHPASSWPRRMCGLRRFLLRFSRPSGGVGVRERRKAKDLRLRRGRRFRAV